LRKADNAVSPEAFDARVALFLDERRFPAPMLRQVLRYQQKQYSWLSPDPALEHADLSLFGYHTIDDWFGPRFLRVVAEFTINSSKIAEQKGYKVSKAEAMADLMRNAEISFQQNINNPYLGVANSTEYFNEQLRQLNMDQNMAAKIWRQVLLFRRLFQDVGNAALVDPLTHQQFYAYAQETVEGDLYRLPEELRFNDTRSLQKFETYLDAVAVRPKDDKALLVLPTEFLTAEEVKKNTPELVQKRYLLLVTQVNKKDLQTKVGLKEMWNWEVEDKNWERLKTEFPDLGIKHAGTREERMIALDSLNDKTRAKVDAFARAEIVDSHPEWQQKALQDAEAKQMIVGLRPTGGNSFVVGLDNRKELIHLLDTVALGTQENTDKLSQEEKEASDKLSRFTADKNTFYRVSVLERTPQEEVLTFAEASNEGILDQLLDRKKSEDPNFDKILNAIRKDYASNNADKTVPSTTDDWAASQRFNFVARNLQAKLKKNPADADTLVRLEEKDTSPEEHLQKRSSLANQWKWVKAPYQVHRGTKIDDLDIDKEEILALGPDAWTKVNTPINGDIFFFQMKQRVNNEDVEATYDKLHQAHGLMADDAQRTYMHAVIDDLKSKNAISLDYLDRNIELMEQPEVQEST
jgi:GcvH upstream region-like protein